MAATRSSILRIVPTSGSAFEFDVQGFLTHRLVRVHNEADEVTEILHEWRVDSALIRTADGTAESTWDRWWAFVDLIQARSGDDLIDTVRIVRDPDSANVVEVDLGTAYERLRITEVEGGGESERSGAATWNAVVPVSMVLTAKKTNADTNGVVDVVQTVTNSFTNGLHTLTKETILTTAAGTNAETKAKALCAIDIAEWGTSYAYLTNSEWGINWDVLDADDLSVGGPRIPTQVRAVSAIQRYAVDVGTTAPGTSPDSILYVVSDQETRDEIRRTVIASAQGPGARAWVLAKKPAGFLTDQQIEDEQSGNVVKGTWIRVTPKAQDTVRDARLILCVISGGRATEWVPNSNGLPPVEFRGALAAWTLTVDLRVEATGFQLKNSDLPLPGPPGDGWVLDELASSEGSPELVERGSTSEADRWGRSAKLVFRRGDKPPRAPLEAIRDADTVESYYL